MQYINPQSIIQNAMRNQMNPIKYPAPYVPRSNGIPTNNEINNVLNNYMAESKQRNIQPPESIQLQPAIQQSEPQNQLEKFDIYIPEQEPVKQAKELLPKKIESFIETYKPKHGSCDNKIIYVIIIVILCFIIFRLYMKNINLKMKLNLLKQNSNRLPQNA